MEDCSFSQVSRAWPVPFSHEIYGRLLMLGKVHVPVEMENPRVDTSFMVRKRWYDSFILQKWMQLVTHWRNWSSLWRKVSAQDGGNNEAPGSSWPYGNLCDKDSNLFIDKWWSESWSEALIDTSHGDTRLDATKNEVISLIFGVKSPQDYYDGFHLNTYLRQGYCLVITFMIFTMRTWESHEITIWIALQGVKMIFEERR